MILIYGLRDPETGKIRYVGQTAESLEGRLQNHISQARRRNGNPRKNEWIRQLLIDGFDGPEIVVLRRARLPKTANRIEAKMIRELYRTTDLLNGIESGPNRNGESPGSCRSNIGIGAVFSRKDYHLIGRAVDKSRAFSRSDWLREVVVAAARRELAK